MQAAKIPPRYFIPARNSRHRTACFALYRALLSQPPHIALPPDLSSAWGPTNPLTHLIRRAFRRNRTDTSPRLVQPALQAGYRMLSQLRNARDPTSPDHASLVSLLRARLAEREASRAAVAKHGHNSRNPRRQSSAPREGTLPLLVDVTPEPTRRTPHPRPVYATPYRPRPRGELGGTGRRTVPHLDLASDFPILRTTKPQPALLSRVLTQKIRKRVARAASLKAMFEEEMPEAELEDEWEGILGRVLKGEELMVEEEEDDGAAWGRGGDRNRDRDRNNRKGGKGGDNEKREKSGQLHNTYADTIYQHGIMHLQHTMTWERFDQVARADAMRRLIAEETKLADEEKAQRRTEKRQRWEGKMREVHGDAWTDKFPGLGEPGKDGSRPSSMEASF